MKMLKNILAAIILLILAQNVLAEGDWRFNVEIGSIRAECNTGYTGSTANALGCTSVVPPARSWPQNQTSDTDFGTSALSKPASNMTGTGSDLGSPVVSNPGQFWTMKDGEPLNYSQLIVSAMIERNTRRSLVETELVQSCELPGGEILASVLELLSIEQSGS